MLLLILVPIILAIAGATDMILKPETSKTVSEKILNWSKSETPSYKTSRLLDKVMGPKIFSFRAYLWTLLLGTLAALLGAIIAVSINPDLLVSGIDVISQSNKRYLYVFAIFIAFASLGDFISFAQTRIFIRAIEEFKDWRTTTVLLLSDFICSLFLFSIFYAAAVTIGFQIVSSDEGLEWEGSSRTSPILTQVVAFDLGLTSENLLKLEEKVKSDEGYNKDAIDNIVNDSYELRAILGMNLSEGLHPNDDIVAMLKRSWLGGSGPIPEYLNISYENKCLSKDGRSLRLLDYDMKANVFGDIAFTYSAVKSIYNENEESYQRFDSSMDEVMALVNKKYEERLSSEDNECFVDIMRVNRVIDVNSSLRSSGFLNRYLSALDGAIQEISRYPTYKFSIFQSKDLSAELSNHILSAKSRDAFDLQGSPDEYYSIGYEINVLANYDLDYNGVTKYIIPGTSFIASSVAVSLVFWVLVFTSYFMRLVRIISSRTMVFVSANVLSEKFIVAAVAIPVCILLTAIGLVMIIAA